MLAAAFICCHAWRASSTEPSSSMVVMSPGSWSRTTAFSTRRIILPLRVFGSISTKFNSPITAMGPRLRRTVCISSRRSSSEGWKPSLRTAKAEITSPLNFIGSRRNAGFGDGGMGQKRRLNLHGADAMSRNLDDLVGATGEPDVAVFIHVGGVSGKVDSLPRDARPVVRGIAGGFAPQGGRQAGEGALYGQDSLLAGAAFFAFQRHNCYVYARQGN